MKRLARSMLLLVLTAGLKSLVTFTLHAEEFKVLAVMSYEQDNPWVTEIKEGIESVLGNASDITYFYMDTKKDLEGGPDQAREAFELYQQLQPHGVIAADDNAQSMFVLPYLKDKVSTPVIFNGVNSAPETYGYPSTNVTGVLERGHIRESIAFVKQLDPSIETVAFIAKESPSGRALKRQVESDADTLVAQVRGIHLVKTTDELLDLGELLAGEVDAVYMDSLEGILDERGVPLTNQQIFEVFSAAYAGPIIGANRYHVDQGALSAVVKTSQEQGEVAARLLLQAMRGTPVAEIPVTRNYHGRRVINVSTLEALGIEPPAFVLRGAILVRTQ